MSKMITRTICAGLLLLAGSIGWALAGRDVPGVIHMKAGPRAEPIWISEEAAATEKGDLRWQFFSPSDQRNLHRFLAESERLNRAAADSAEHQATGKRQAELACPIVLASSEEGRIDPKPNRTFADLAQQSLAIYRGRIDSISHGFFDGLPSSLLEVKVTEAFRSSELVAGDEVLIPYPFARFKIGSATFCGGSDAIFQPVIGNQVLVFIYDPPLNAARTLVYPLTPELFFQTSKGHHGPQLEHRAEARRPDRSLRGKSPSADPP